MIQELDALAARAKELCETCGGLKVISMQGQVHYPCERCLDADDKPTGRKYPGLSKWCRHRMYGYQKCGSCDQTSIGRVPVTVAEGLYWVEEELGRLGTWVLDATDIEDGYCYDVWLISRLRVRGDDPSRIVSATKALDAALGSVAETEGK